MHKKKFDNQTKKWFAHCWAASLVQQCNDRDSQAQCSGDSGDNGAIKQYTLASVFADKTALIDERLSFIGYLKIMFILFKITLFGKKRKGCIKIVRCVVQEDSLFNSSTRDIGKHS